MDVAALRRGAASTTCFIIPIAILHNDAAVDSVGAEGRAGAGNSSFGLAFVTGCAERPAARAVSAILSVLKLSLVCVEPDASKIVHV